MSKLFKNTRVAIPTMGISVLATHSYAHPGDHSGSLSQMVAHLLASPWHLLVLVLAVLFAIGTIWTVAAQSNKRN